MKIMGRLSFFPVTAGQNQQSMKSREIVQCFTQFYYIKMFLVIIKELFKQQSESWEKKPFKARFLKLLEYKYYYWQLEKIVRGQGYNYFMGK